MPHLRILIVVALIAAVGLYLWQGRPATERLVVEVTARDYAFQAPAEISAGWTTFQFPNQGEEPHFFLLSLLPEGKTIDDYRTEVGPAFNRTWEALQAGTADKAAAAQMLGEQLPEWYAGVEAMGGTGIVSPGRTAQTTLRLTPGVYVMECYVKTPEGTFHTELGMMQSLRVTLESTEIQAPSEDLNITVSNEGIIAPDRLSPGRHTVAVQFVNHPPVGLGNDIHAVRLSEDVTVDQVAPWMDWMNIEGLRSPAPIEFLGGAQEMPVGHTAYFTVDLTPGRYAWIAEQPADRGLWATFVVE